jgi:hypothetical protein
MWIATQGVRFADSMQNDVDYTAAGGCHDVFKKATNNGVDAVVCFSVSDVGSARREYASNDEAWCVAWLCLPGAQPKTERFV